MQKKFTFVMLLIIIASFSSCLHLYEPPFLEEDLIRNDVIVGQWKTGDKLIKIETYSLSRLADITNIQTGPSNENKLSDREKDSLNFAKIYVLSYSINNSTYYYSVGLGIAGDRYFAQLMPLICIKNDSSDNESRYNAFTGGEVLSTYAIARIRFTEKNKLDLEFIDGDKIKEMITNGNAKIPYAYDEVFNNFLITADKAQLYNLLKKYGNDGKIYSELHSYHYTKVTIN